MNVLLAARLFAGVKHFHVFLYLLTSGSKEYAPFPFFNCMNRNENDLKDIWTTSDSHNEQF